MRHAGNVRVGLALFLLISGACADGPQEHQSPLAPLLDARGVVVPDEYLVIPHRRS
jgi:hypothetical protein